jgi:hypothetical protein
MNKILLAFTKLIIIVFLILKSSHNIYAQRHNNLIEARDCYYVITFDSLWRPRSIFEDQVLSNGSYVSINRNNERYFMHRFQDSSAKVGYTRSIFLRKKELEQYVLKGNTTVSENKWCEDTYGWSNKLQFKAQRVLFMGKNSKGEDSIVSIGYQYFLDTNKKCTKQFYDRSYKNYYLYSYGAISKDCDEQSTIIRYSWFKDNKEILTVITSNQKKAMFLRRPDNDSCLAAYFILSNNSNYSMGVTTHWLVDDFEYLYNRFLNGDPVQAYGNNSTTDFLKHYIKDYPGTLLFPMKNKNNWNTIDPDIKTWLEIPVVEKEVLKSKWNSAEFNQVISMIAHLLGDEYMTDPGYWSPGFNSDGFICPGLGTTTDIY